MEESKVKRIHSIKIDNSSKPSKTLAKKSVTSKAVKVKKITKTKINAEAVKMNAARYLDLQIQFLLDTGKKVKEIARTLNISDATVRRRISDGSLRKKKARLDVYKQTRADFLADLGFSFLNIPAHKIHDLDPYKRVQAGVALLNKEMDIRGNLVGGANIYIKVIAAAAQEIFTKEPPVDGDGKKIENKLKTKESLL